MKCKLDAVVIEVLKHFGLIDSFLFFKFRIYYKFSKSNDAKKKTDTKTKFFLLIKNIIKSIFYGMIVDLLKKTWNFVYAWKIYKLKA